MDFDFSNEQKQFREEVRRLLNDASPLRETRLVLEGKQPFARRAWEELANLGFQGVTIPESYGGSGLGYLEACVAAEEIGRSLAAIPSLSSVYICTEAIRLLGNDEQKHRWLPGLASGTVVGTWAAAEKPGELSLDRIETSFNGGKLNGVKTPVLDGGQADVCVVLAKGVAKAPVLVVCDLSSSKVTRAPVDSVDPSRPLAQVRFVAADAQLLDTQQEAWTAYNDLLNRAAVLLAFEQLGAADRALHQARDYALQRHAFGRPIGANQAIKHKLANVYTRNELARVHAYYGAWAISTNSAEVPLAAAGARVSANDAFSFAAQENIQTHGGIGFTWESDCQLFYRRARFCATALGATHFWKDRIVQALESTNSRGQ